MKPKKHGILTFKADAALVAALHGVENRSEFIRNAILSALESACPLCHGSGILTPNQRKHWDRFAEKHELDECGTCHEPYLKCRDSRGGRQRCPATS